MSIGNYSIKGQPIGHGRFGIVYLATRNDSPNEDVALKEIKPDSSVSDSKTVQREIDVLRSLPFNNHLVRMLDCFVNPPGTNDWVLVLEYCRGGNLRNFLKKLKKTLKRNFLEKEAVVLLKHVAAGFKVLSDMNVLHRDIKPANILLDHAPDFELTAENGILGITFKISDMGLSKIVPEDSSSSNTICGSDGYQAPEIINCPGERGRYNGNVDLFALAVVIIYCLNGKRPWEKKDFHTPVTAAFLNEKVESALPKELSQGLEDLLRKMLKFDALERIDFPQFFEAVDKL